MLILFFFLFFRFVCVLLQAVSLTRSMSKEHCSSTPKTIYENETYVHSYCTTAVTEDVSIVTYNSNGGWQQWHHPHHPSVLIYFEHCQQALLESSGVIVRYYVFYARLPYDKSDMVVATTLAAV
uniref:Secreted protein n=1 Tax=Glossina palpalis gambiensis TaxID=67801 RepID=A0A1B0BN85_9MUSC